MSDRGVSGRRVFGVLVLLSAVGGVVASCSSTTTNPRQRSRASAGATSTAGRAAEGGSSGAGAEAVAGGGVEEPGGSEPGGGPSGGVPLSGASNEGGGGAPVGFGGEGAVAGSEGGVAPSAGGTAGAGGLDVPGGAAPGGRAAGGSATGNAASVGGASGTSTGGGQGGASTGGGQGGGGGAVVLECAGPTDCVSPAVCQSTLGATCEEGTCRYPLLPLGTDCDDGSGCFANGQCTATGACVGDPLLTCEEPPEPECVSADLVRVFSPVGTCQAGGCAYGSVEFACPSCPDCLVGCVIDVDGDGTVDSVDRGALAPDDGCRICDPARSRAHYSDFECTQETPLDPCLSLAGSCDSGLLGGDCAGADCCVFEPVWDGISSNQPSCPLAGEDPNQDGIEDPAEGWSGVCTTGSACAGCTSTSQCDDGNPCTADECVNGACHFDPAPIAGQSCAIAAPGDGVCVATATTGVCRLAVGEACAAASDCATGACECANDSCSAHVCASQVCGVCRYTPTGSACTGGLGTNVPTPDPRGCSGDRACYAGVCYRNDGAACSSDSDCQSNRCECGNPDCSVHICASVSCGQCTYTPTGTSCSGYRATGTPCTDGSTQTIEDRCASGVCSGRIPEYNYSVPAGTFPCGDHVDNDGDGLVDCADPDCTGHTEFRDGPPYYCCDCACGEDISVCCC